MTHSITAAPLQRAREILEANGYSMNNTPEEVSGAARPIIDAFNAIVGDIRFGAEGWDTIGRVIKRVARSDSGFHDLLNQAIVATDEEFDDCLQLASDLLREAGEARATGQAESLRRHQEAIAALRRAIRLSRENGEPVSVFVLERVVQVAEHGVVDPVTIVEDQYHSGGQPVTVDRVEAPPVIERRDGYPDYEPKWRSTPIHDMKASGDQPEVFHGYSETDGGRVEISIQVASDGTGTGMAVLPSGREVSMDIDAELVGLMKQGKACVSIEGVHGSGEGSDGCPHCKRYPVHGHGHSPDCPDYLR